MPLGSEQTGTNARNALTGARAIGPGFVPAPGCGRASGEEKPTHAVKTKQRVASDWEAHPAVLVRCKPP